jgi:TolB-like protein/DNA-binding winged helix-turn-helix (wHTH) protein/Flp pilus assembly protein TadD
MRDEAKRLYRFGPFRLDGTERLLLRDGATVALTPKAFETLLVLVEHGGRVVGKNELIEAVWPDVFVEEGSLTRNISVLRKALGEAEDGRAYIETVPKRGYRFAAEVLPAGPESSDGATPADSAASPPEPVPAHAITPRRLLVSAGLVVGLAVAATLLAYVGGWRPRWAGAGGVAPVRTVAVLPLENLSGDPAQDYFADGMTESLTTELAKIGALHVISRTSAMQYKATRKSLPEIARELGVDAVVEGSVVRSGGRVRVTAQLIRAATDEHLWAQDYERDLSDVVALEGEVARAIAAEVRVTLTPQEQAHLSGTRTVNPAAHDLYLKGLYLLNEGINRRLPAERRAWVSRADEVFEQAVALDDRFAEAHAGIARAHLWGPIGVGPPGLARAKTEALRAIELDESLAEAHAALASLEQVGDWDYAAAEREFRRAIELNPSYAEAHLGYAILLSCLERHPEALAEIQRAEELDPRTISIRVYYGGILIRAHENDRAIEQLEGTLELDPSYPGTHAQLGEAYTLERRYAEAETEFRRAVEASGSEPRFTAQLAWSLAVSGRRAEAATLVETLEQTPTLDSVAQVQLASAEAALGNADGALTRLEKLYAEDRVVLWWLNGAQEFDTLSDTPRYRDLLRRLRSPA